MSAARAAPSAAAAAAASSSANTGHAADARRFSSRPLVMMSCTIASVLAALTSDGFMLSRRVSAP